MNKITVVGSINMDISICSDTFPKIGETIQGYNFSTQPGGKGSNQAIAIGNLGGNVSFLGCLGDDDNGKILCNTLREHNVDTSHTEIIANQPSGTAVILVCNGDNSIVINSGANAYSTENFLKKHSSVIAESKILLSQLEITMLSVLTAFQLAKNHGVTTILNPAPILTLPRELLQLTDIMILNQTEAEFLTKHPIKNMDDAKTGILNLLHMGITKAIITLGSLGCMFTSDSGAIEYQPARAVTAIDSTGAGDSFCGAVAYALSNDRSLGEAVRLATLVSSITVTKRGAALSIPTKDEVNIILKKEGSLHELS